MIRVTHAGFCLALVLTATPAFAQMSMGGTPGGGNAPPVRARIPDIAPVGVPGAPQTPVSTGPVMAKPTIADPTQALFAAITSGDYNAAQDALSRGANLQAQDALGETPLDLSVSLNRTNITFLLLQTRNETGGGEGPISPGPAFPSPARQLNATPAKATAKPLPVPVMGNDPGTPNPQSGFLGFGSRS